MKHLVATVKANKKTIIKRTIIAAAVTATVLVVGALYKANADVAEEIFTLEVPVTE